MVRTASSSSHLGLRHGPEAVHGPAPRLTAHARHVRAHAAELGGRRDGLELERQPIAEACPPAAVDPLHLRSLGKRRRLPSLEQDGQAGPRRSVDVVGGVEEGQRERRGAHRSSLR
jgi:hypothetical protein